METNSQEEDVTPQPAAESIAEPAEGPITEARASDEPAGHDPQPSSQELPAFKESAESQAVEPPIEATESPVQAVDETPGQTVQTAEESAPAETAAGETAPGDRARLRRHR